MTQKKPLLTLNHLVNNTYTVHALRTGIQRSFHINATGYHILLELIKSDGVAAPINLAEALSLTPSTITASIAHLEATDYVCREDSDEDRRKTPIRITAAGMRLVPQIDQLVIAIIAETWQPLTQAQKELMLRGSISIVNGRRNFRLNSGKVRADTAYADAVFITNRSLAYMAKQHGLTLNEFLLLFVLRDHPRGITATGAAQLLLMRQNNLTKVSESLLGRDFAERDGNPLDRRVSIFLPTRTGALLFNRAFKDMDEATRSHFQGVDRKLLEAFRRIGEDFIVAERKRRRFSTEAFPGDGRGGLSRCL
ncbi:MAG: MarR family transcriptional regulator [Coriobacteriales bacterium]|jgi:DNA-binding MarR family transcriptional regulator|nr:MarR family transcriptional regulator [Coriobacteriales bacterium]